MEYFRYLLGRDACQKVEHAVPNVLWTKRGGGRMVGPARAIRRSALVGDKRRNKIRDRGIDKPALDDLLLLPRPGRLARGNLGEHQTRILI